jgi:DNA-binding NtrC family response regulator
MCVLSNYTTGEIMKISDLLIKTNGNKSEVARILGVQRSTVRRFMSEHHNHIIVRDGEVYSLFVRVGG